ncbi:hypothetical protein HY498_02870 [Candidatus Woesearchaeota archaeon]|nr:hypothetical protein [Candidatus Woesearchaeota archaeon]
MLKVGILIFIIIILISSCTQIQTYKETGKERFKTIFQKEGQEPEVDISLKGIGAQLRIVRPVEGSNVRSGVFQYVIDLSGSNILDANPRLNQKLLTSSNVYSDSISSQEILDAITDKKGKVTGQFNIVSEEESLTAHLFSELSYDGLSQARFYGCIANDLGDYYNNCKEGNLLRSNIAGSEFKILEILEEPISRDGGITSYLFTIKFYKDRPGELIGDIDFDVVDFPEGCGEIRWEKDKMIGIVGCEVQLSSRNLDLPKGFQEFDGYFRMNYQYKIRDEVIFNVKPKF